MYAWNFDGIKIPDVCSFDAATQEVIGTAFKGNEMFKWWATVGPHGWTVVIENSRCMRQTYTGPTFSLFCEVAAAIRRLS